MKRAPSLSSLLLLFWPSKWKRSSLSNNPRWKSEIETKTTKGWRILIHHGSGRPKTAAALKQYDIVLTTYGTLVSESGLTVSVVVSPLLTFLDQERA